MNWVKKGCATGTTFGGKTKVKADTRAKMCAAVASWEAKKAKSKAKTAAKKVSEADAQITESEERSLLVAGRQRLLLAEGLLLTMNDTRASRAAKRSATANAVKLLEGKAQVDWADANTSWATATKLLERDRDAWKAIVEALTGTTDEGVEADLGAAEGSSEGDLVVEAKRTGGVKGRGGGAVRDPEFEKKHPRVKSGRTGGGQFLQLGSSGQQVRQVQKAIGTETTGEYDQATQRAVRQYQRENGLVVDGIVGHQTTAALKGKKGAKKVEIGALSASDLKALKKLSEAKLSSKGRKQVSEDNFALPGRRYPIHDISHARNALSRVSQHGSEEEKKKVRAAVYRKYPSLKGGKMQEAEWERAEAEIKEVLRGRIAEAVERREEARANGNGASFTSARARERVYRAQLAELEEASLRGVARSIKDAPSGPNFFDPRWHPRSRLGRFVDVPDFLEKDARMARAYGVRPDTMPMDKAGLPGAPESKGLPDLDTLKRAYGIGVAQRGKPPKRPKTKEPRARKKSLADAYGVRPDALQMESLPGSPASRPMPPRFAKGDKVRVFQHSGMPDRRGVVKEVFPDKEEAMVDIENVGVQRTRTANLGSTGAFPDAATLRKLSDTRLRELEAEGSVGARAELKTRKLPDAPEAPVNTDPKLKRAFGIDVAQRGKPEKPKEPKKKKPLADAYGVRPDALQMESLPGSPAYEEGYTRTPPIDRAADTAERQRIRAMGPSNLPRRDNEGNIYRPADTSRMTDARLEQLAGGKGDSAARARAELEARKLRRGMSTSHGASPASALPRAPFSDQYSPDEPEFAAQRGYSIDPGQKVTLPDGRKGKVLGWTEFGETVAVEVGGKVEEWEPSSDFFRRGSAGPDEGTLPPPGFSDLPHVSFRDGALRKPLTVAEVRKLPPNDREEYLRKVAHAVQRAVWDDNRIFKRGEAYKNRLEKAGFTLPGVPNDPPNPAMSPGLPDAPFSATSINRIAPDADLTNFEKATGNVSIAAVTKLSTERLNEIIQNPAASPDLRAAARTVLAQRRGGSPLAMAA